MPTTNSGRARFSSLYPQVRCGARLQSSPDLGSFSEFQGREKRSLGIFSSSLCRKRESKCRRGSHSPLPQLPSGHCLDKTTRPCFWDDERGAVGPSGRRLMLPLLGPCLAWWRSLVLLAPSLSVRGSQQRCKPAAPRHTPHHPGPVTTTPHHTTRQKDCFSKS
ncbi:hypothetical protein PWT90_07688 [Aphanocladium album]|nr:hypothetical protein PWT90_07688 [Aphanocladium album]